ncbi:CBS domain-containing protein [Parapedobacter deserti]|uniref:CBS domain-containing protein n=1 Tax=Parapedobacter deserti TaxID=1912957 RepID=A0ABV7JQG0_9SPHI
MNIGQVIAEHEYAVSPSASIRDTLDKMADLQLAQLPVVKDDLFFGLVSYEALASIPNVQEHIQDADAPYLQIHIFDTQHLYDATLFFQIHQLDLLPVLNDQHQYIGAVTPLDLITALSQSMSLHQPGGIIVLEMGNRDNALSHIAHIVESDNAQILNSYVTAYPDSARLEVTIKVNKSDVSSIVAAFFRHDYVVKATYNEGNNRDNSRDRFEQLMNYINM